MVDKYCWFGPGANKPFDSKLSDWKNSNLSKRSIYVLKFIKEHSPMDIDEYNSSIIDYLLKNKAGSKKLISKHTYSPFLFVNFISKKNNKLKITEYGIDFLNNINKEKFEKATEIYLDQLFNVNFETEATKDIEIHAYPIQIMFKLLYDKKIIPLFMFQTHIQYIKNFSYLNKCFNLLDDDCFLSYIQKLDAFYKEDKDKFKEIYKIATEKWKSYVIGCLVSLEIFDKTFHKKGYLKFSEDGLNFVQKQGIDNISYESLFY